MSPRRHHPDGLTSRSIAALSGVSQTTVSRVLSNHPNVSPSTRERVLRVLDETGYSPSAAARAMRTQSTGVLGVVVGRVTNPFYPQLAEALHQEISQRSLQMSLWISDGARDDGGELAALSAVQHRAIDGVIYTTVTSHSPSFQLAIARSAPIVLLNRTLDDVAVDSVASDNQRGAADVAGYLLGHGHRRVALITGPADISTAREREAGFRAGLRVGGVSLEDGVVVRGDFTHAAGHDALVRLLDATTSPPSAVFCVNDVIAFGVIDAARERGMRVPDDLWVIGYDDTEIARWASYDLTTVRQPAPLMARRGVDLLMERIAGEAPAAARSERLVGELVVRGSTAHAPA